MRESKCIGRPTWGLVATNKGNQSVGNAGSRKKSGKTIHRIQSLGGRGDTTLNYPCRTREKENNADNLSDQGQDILHRAENVTQGYKSTFHQRKGLGEDSKPTLALRCSAERKIRSL